MNNTLLSLGAAIMTEKAIVDKLEESINQFREDGDFEGVAHWCLMAMTKHILKKSFDGDFTQMAKEWEAKIRVMKMFEPQPQ